MLVGQAVAALVAGSPASDTDRAAIRRALSPLADQLQRDAGLLANALARPDAEYGLSLLLDVASCIEAAVRDLDAGLSSPAIPPAHSGDIAA